MAKLYFHYATMNAGKTTMLKAEASISPCNFCRTC